jgi:hypothetical protein
VSYSIGLLADLGGPEHVDLDLHWNYTSNCAQMWFTAGIYLIDYDGLPAGDCLPSLKRGIAHMRAEPARYEAMNPPNGWGSYAGLLAVLDQLVVAFERAPRAIVSVSR